MNERSPEWWRAIGEAIAFDHGQWEFQARILLRGASLCFSAHRKASERAGAGDLDGEAIQDLPVSIVAIFLAAQGIEVLLKTIALLRNSDKVRATPKQFYNHDLKAIASLANIPLDDREAQIMTKLGTQIEWAGRYPAPKWDTEKSRKKYDVPIVAENGRNYINPTDLPGIVEWEDIQQIVGKLYGIYDDEK